MGETMNWKKRYESFKKGDIVRMVKPCTRCTAHTESGRLICWERCYKDNNLTCLSDEYLYRGNILVDVRIPEGEHCNVTKESLVKK